MKSSPVVAISFDQTYVSVEQATKSFLLTCLLTAIQNDPITAEDLKDENNFEAMDCLTQTFIQMTCGNQRGE